MKQSREPKSQFLFQNELPENILEKLTPEIRRQYFLWDEIIKREIELYPWLILPLIKEIFQKEYPKNVSLELLSTEYAVTSFQEYGGQILHSIHSDLLIKVGEKDIYHFECQMEQDRNMVLRMMEYDVHIALVHGVERDDIGSKKEKRKVKLSFPKSVILYLTHTKNTPDQETCVLNLPDGSSCLYQVPVLKVQDYSLSMIEEKHLNMLIPFLPIRLKKAIKKGCRKNRSSVQKELTELLENSIMLLNREKENGTLTEGAKNDLIEFLYRACEHLFAGEPEVLREVHEIMEPAIKLWREVVQEELNEKEAKLENSIKNLIQKSQKENKTQEEIQALLKEIFMLDESEVQEKIQRYFKE